MSNDAAIAERVAGVVTDGFEGYHRTFLSITRRAKARFEQRDWLGTLADGRERLALYNRALGEVLTEVRPVLGAREHEIPLWTAIRAAHARTVLGHRAGELAETFFNSLTRRVFGTVGTNPAIEYLDFRFERIPGPMAAVPCRTIAAEDDVERAVRELLHAYPFSVPWVDLEDDARRVAEVIVRAWVDGEAPHPLEAIEALEPVFYRRKGAYVLGRVRGGNRVMPLALALVHGEGGVMVDAVLTTESDVSVVFSFTRSYFRAEVAAPRATIEFLRTLMPLKPVAELYTSLGHHKHGKTEFYRALQRHLARTTERFERTPGAPGTVMEVFALPSLDMVFKVIRDTFPASKHTSADEVQRRYRMVFAHDRAGRLVEAQRYDGLAFPRGRFAPRLLAELTENAGRTVQVDGDAVVLRRAYVERRVRPLDVYLDEASSGDALAAALGYGQTIRDLASTGIFPGDLLLKNFGLTRHDRVVFYDYDELRLLEECRFRDLPEPRTPEEELADEPWFHVAPDDVFPEELTRFVPFDGDVRGRYLAEHGALYTRQYWQELKERQAAGDVVDVFPYPEERRLRR